MIRITVINIYFCITNNYILYFYFYVFRDYYILEFWTLRFIFYWFGIIVH